MLLVRKQNFYGVTLFLLREEIIKKKKGIYFNEVLIYLNVASCYTTEDNSDFYLISFFKAVWKGEKISLILHISSWCNKLHFSFTLQLVDRVFDESLNFRKIPPLVHAKPPDGNGRPNDTRPQLPDAMDPPTITRRRTWSRDEVRTKEISLW